MVDFSSLLKKPAGEAKKPEALYIGNYPGIIKSYELGDKNKNNTPYVRLHLAALGWPEGLEPQRDAKNEVIDLSKRQLRRDMYLTEDAMWRLDELLRDLGITVDGRLYEECIPEMVGKHVLIEVTQEPNKDKTDMINIVNALKAL